MSDKIAIIRVRGKNKISKKIVYTLTLLRLRNKNHCVVLDKSDNLMGMIHKIKDYITYGEIDEQTLKVLFEKRGKEAKAEDKKFLEFNNKKYKPFFALNSPKKGYEKMGIKVAFKVGGALGYRADKINDLIKRMI